MAVTWGSAKGASGAATKFRVGINVSVPTPGTGDTSVTVTTQYWVWTKDRVNNDTSVSLTIGGTAVTAGTQTVTVNTPSNSDWSTTNKKLVYTETKSIAVTNVAQTLTATASMTGLDAAGASEVATHSVNATLKASPALPPAAPTGLAVTSVGVLTWTNTNPASTTAPYRGIEVERWDNVTNAWYNIAKLGVVTSFTDISLAGDRTYAYRIMATNSGGKSAYLTQAGTIQTIPATPAAPTARRPVTNVEVSWTNTSTVATGYEVWHSVNGVLDGARLALVALPALSYTHVAPSNTDSHVYYLKAVGASLTSPMSLGSTAVVPYAKPLSASNLAPSGGIYDASAPIALTFDHNPTDGTTQVGFKPKWREQGTAAWSAPTGQSLSASADTATSVITASGHSLNAGDIVKVTGTAPSPLVVGVQYFAIPISATQFRVASSEENALAGIAIGLTTAGSFSITNGRIVSNTSSYTIPGGTLAAGKAWEWTVATDGRYAGINPSGPWAPMGGFRTATKPTLTINSPEAGSSIGSPQVMASWVFFSPDAGVVQQWAQVALYQGSELLEVYEGTGEWGVYVFEYDLVNGATYRVEVQAEGSNGIRSDVYSSTFDADYVGPAVPGLELTWDSDEGLVLIDIENPADIDSPDVVSNTIYRSVAGGDYVLAVSNVGPNTTVIDYLPTPNAVNTYKVVATADDGTKTTYVASVSCQNKGDWFWLNGGPSFDVRAKVRYEGSTTTTFSLDKALHTFAGRTAPVEFSGTATKYEIEVSALLTRDDEGFATYDDLLTLVRTPGNVWYRDRDGRSLRCSLGEVELSDRDDQLMEFRASLTEVSK